jgi:hypothetical protein
MITLPLWTRHFNALSDVGFKVIVCRRDGYLMAVANWDEIARPSQLVGLKWQEFCHPDDIAHVLAWHAVDPNDAGIVPLTFRGMGIFNGVPGPAVFSLVKYWAGDAWVAVGNMAPASEDPSTPGSGRETSAS